MEVLEKIKEELKLLKQHIYYGDLHLATWSIEKIEEYIEELEEELEELEYLANKAYNLSIRE